MPRWVMMDEEEGCARRRESAAAAGFLSCIQDGGWERDGGLGTMSVELVNVQRRQRSSREAIPSRYGGRERSGWRRRRVERESR